MFKDKLVDCDCPSKISTLTNSFHSKSISTRESGPPTSVCRKARSVAERNFKIVLIISQNIIRCKKSDGLLKDKELKRKVDIKESTFLYWLS